MKFCSKCKIEKPFECFGVNKRLKSGFNSWCKICVTAKKKADYQADPQKFRDRKNKEYLENKELILGRAKKAQSLANARRRHRYANDEQYRIKILALSKTNAHRELCKKWQRENPAKMEYHNARRRSLKLNATPPWLTAIHEAQMQEMYDIARARTVQTGIEHHVDHIHPLKGKGFNGLHVPWNLQVITASENLSKRNNLPKEEQHLMWSL